MFSLIYLPAVILLNFQYLGFLDICRARTRQVRDHQLCWSTQYFAPRSGIASLMVRHVECCHFMLRCASSLPQALDITVDSPAW